jgi:hypothetical protein
MIDTKAIRAGGIVTLLELALCDALDAANARAERLAAYARALKAYDEQLERPTIETTTECWQLGSAVVNAEAALLPGEADTFWNAPDSTIDGEIGMVMLPDPSDAVSAVTTKFARFPVDSRDCGFTAYTASN